jgi:hypothetical protein
MSGASLGTGTVLVLDPATFNTQFPAFNTAPVVTTDTQIEAAFSFVESIISTTDYGFLNGTARQNALYLLTAHLLQLQLMAVNNTPPGFVTDATVDKIKVTVQPPPVKSQFGWWLNQTVYGAQLWALLNAIAVGGVYVGGRGTIAAYRGPAGYRCW